MSKKSNIWKILGMTGMIFGFLGTMMQGYEAPIVFFDCEVFPNLLLVNWKFQSKPDKDEPTVYRLINPSADDIAKLSQYRLIGFNNRKYDNHMRRLPGNTDPPERNENA